MNRKGRTIIQPRLRTAETTLRLSRHNIDYLRTQWDDQRESQLSARARMHCGSPSVGNLTATTERPTQLKKALETIFELQDQVEELEQAITAAEKAFPHSAEVSNLRAHHRLAVASAESLYGALDVHAGFPELIGHSPDFARLLLQAHDIKQRIQRRASGQLWEMSRLDQAARGRHMPLGT